MASSHTEPWIQCAGWWDSRQFFSPSHHSLRRCAAAAKVRRTLPHIGTIVFWIKTMDVGSSGSTSAKTADGRDFPPAFTPNASTSSVYSKVSLTSVRTSGGNEKKGLFWFTPVEMVSGMHGYFHPLHPMAEQRYLGLTANPRQLIKKRSTLEKYYDKFAQARLIVYFLHNVCSFNASPKRCGFQILHRTPCCWYYIFVILHARILFQICASLSVHKCVLFLVIYMPARTWYFH